MDTAPPLPVDESTEAEDPFAAMDPEMAAHPQPMFKMLRDEMPVMPVDNGVVVSRKIDVDAVLRDPATFSSNVDAVDLSNRRPLIPLQIDPPEHKKFRKLLDPIFAPREVAKLEESLTAAVDELIDAFIDRGEVDFSKEFSTLFPTRVFLGLLGLPIEELPTFLNDEGRDHPAPPRHRQPVRQPRDQGLPAGHRRLHLRVLRDVLDQREAERKDDLLSRFLDATVEGEQLTREDILDICFLFLIAGLDTVTATLDCIFGYLVAHPEQRRAIVEDPSIIPAAIEELLRWETPVMGVVRVATEDTELSGCPIARGQSVMILLGSVNTDEADVPDADVVRFDREVNRHVAFGGGVHRCLGSHLARLELRVAMRQWHRRIADYSVPDGHTLVYTPSIRSIDYFPMEFTRAD